MALRQFHKEADGEKNPDRIIECACRNLTRERTFKSVWIGLFDASGLLTAGYHTGLGENFSELLEQLRERAGDCCACQALRQEPVVARRDPAVECPVCPLTESCDGRGVLTVRIQFVDKVYGTISVSVPSPAVDDPGEKELIREAAFDIARALHEAELAQERERTGMVGELQGVVVDISDCKQAESALLESERKFRSLFDTSIDWVWETDARGVYRYVSDNVAQVIGYNPEEIVGRTPFDFMSPEEAERMGEVFRKLAAGGKRFTGLEDTLLHRDGSPRVFETNAVPLFGESGQLTGYFGTCRDITDIKKAELALEQSEAALNESQVLAGIGSFVWDLRDDSLVYSKNMLALAGLDPAKFSGSMTGVVRNLVHPEDRPRVNAEVERMLAQGETWPMEFRVIRPDGSERIWESRSRFSFDEKGRPERCVGLHFDITERRRSQERIEALAGLLDASPASITVHDFDGNFLYVNERTLTLHGYTWEELKQLNLRDLDDPGAGELIGERMREVSQKGHASFEVSHLHKNGTSIPLQVEVKHARWGDRDVMFSIALDISERKKAEEERRRLAAAVEQAAESIMITDASGVIEYVNPAFEKTSGYTAEEVRGRGAGILKSGRQDAEFYRQLWATITGGSAWSGRMVNRKKDGSLFTEECMISPVRGEGGEINHFVAVKSDVSKALELEDQLRQSQKMEAVGRLAGGIAHDLNNLLTPILGYAALFQEEFGAGDPRRENAEAIYDSGEKARVLVRQLLAFGRKQPLEVQSVDLNVVVSGFQELLRRTLREDIRIELDLASSVMTVRADPGQIEQVLMNLVINAQDAMPEGGWLTLRTANVDLSQSGADKGEPVSQGPYVMLAVCDTGCGMDMEVQERVFDPFFTTKEKGKGTGLGLATVYGIVRQHGGTIRAASIPGKGSTFTMYLPAAPEHKAKSRAATESSGTAGNGETVLVAEDNEVVRNLACSMLRRLGYTVISGRTARDCLSIAAERTRNIDLLLSDVVMPDMNGRELYERVRSYCPGVRVVFMSGYPDEVIADRGVLQKGIRLIQKPFTLEQLAEKVGKALNQPSD
jgi:PAS domain S-box-containing protein